MTTTATERVGRYQLLEPIGHGPSGTVSRAKVFGVAGFERQFAIKRFHPELTSGQQAQALSTAARAYGGLEHPRIARMSEFGIAQGTTYTAVEYVAGLDAMRLMTEIRLSSGMLAAGGALALVSQAARAVGYAHGRGLTHLGLSPTNVVITTEGDVKITDFGIFAATLPTRPTEVARLAHRIAYLAPEQVSNEATSAATDVFALGVLAYELITGQRTFRGDTPQAIAKAITGGPPADPTLPKPIVRVLQRCLARSPFERFPDARALADALDAALRVAPVPGTRKDIGSQVNQILERLADLHSGELSGMLSLSLGTANLGPVAQVAALGASRDSQGEVELATMEFVRPDTPVAGPSPLLGPSRTTRNPDEQSLVFEDDPVPTLRAKPGPGGTLQMQDIVRIPPHTVPGLAPPPVPVPPGMSPPSLPPMPTPNAHLAASPKMPRPLVGAVPPPKPGQGPTRPIAVPLDGPPDRPSESPVSPLKMMHDAPMGSAPAVPIAHVYDNKKQLFGALRPDTDQPGSARTDLVIETDPGELLQADAEDMDPPSAAPPSAAPPSESLSVEMQIVSPEELQLLGLDPDEPADRPTHEMSPLLRDQLANETARRSDEVPAWRPSSLDELSASQPVPEPPPPSLDQPPDRKTLAGFTPSRSLPAQRNTPASAAFSQQSERNLETMAVRSIPANRSKLPWVIAAVLGAAAVGAGAYVAYDILGGDDSVATKTVDAAIVATANDAGTQAADTAVVADAVPAIDAVIVAAIDARPAIDAGTTIDAGTAVDATVAKIDPASGDTFTITSTPIGAHVYLDGADSGVTPVKLPGTPDKHSIAVFLAGHDLHVAKAVDGHGSYAVTLKEVTPPGGPAGIKVVKCKDKDRYYVYLDGKPTGMGCPTERIECNVGAHTIETYDLVTETRKQYPVDVKDTRLSVRVRVE